MQKPGNDYKDSISASFIEEFKSLYQSFCQIDAIIDIKQRMMSKPEFEESQLNLIRDDLNKAQKTIVIDIQGTMVTRVTEEVK